MNKQKISYIGSAVVALLLIAYAAYVLIGINSDVLITAQDRNIMAGNSMNFSDIIARPFDFFQNVGGFLTQFFYYPAVGAGMLIALWTACFFVGVKAFRLKGAWRSLMIVPVACLMAATVDLGYWIYCLNIHGYWFSQSVAFLCFLLVLWAANATPRRFRIVWYVVIGFVLFPVFGWFSYLFVICFALSQFKKEDGKLLAPKLIDVVGVFAALVAPIIFHAIFYQKVPADEVFTAGFPIFKTFTNSSLKPSIPFFMLAGAAISLSFGRIFPQIKKVPAFVAGLVVGAAAAFLVWNAMFKDENYLYEMQMTQATMDDDWQGVIHVAEQTNHPSRTMVMLKNIALMNTGELGKRSFKLGNSGVEINNPDSLQVNIMQIAGPLIYFNYGKMNYSLRWGTEFSVSYGFSPYFLKILARCAGATGETKLAKRYTDRLNSLLFYSDWNPTIPSPIAKKLQEAFLDALDADDNSCERYLISTFSRASDASSPIISELSLFYSMIMREPNRFASAFYDYAKLCKDEYVPEEYEEAYSLFVDKNPDKFQYRVKVSPGTTDSYKNFLDTGERYAQYGYDKDGVANEMFNEWGGTYWWFNAFGRDSY